MRIFIIVMGLAGGIASAWGAYYSYKYYKSRNQLIDKLNHEGIVGYARVVDKSESSVRRINVSTNGSQNFDSYTLGLKYNINYRPEDDEPISWKRAMEGKLHKSLTPEYQEFNYNVGAQLYHNVYQGSKIPIMFHPDIPGTVMALESDGQLRSKSWFLPSIFLLLLSLVYWYALLVYLITGKAI